jgi:hypothetical protein
MSFSVGFVIAIAIFFFGVIIRSKVLNNFLYVTITMKLVADAYLFNGSMSPINYQIISFFIKKIIYSQFFNAHLNELIKNYPLVNRLIIL